MSARTYPNPLLIAFKGGLAGLAGTFAISFAMQRVPPLLHSLGWLEQAPATPDEAAVQAAQPTQKLASKVAGGVLERELDTTTREMAGEAIHWTYGVAWGAMYGLTREGLGWPGPLHGTLFGALVAAVASTLVPAMRLTPPPGQQPPVMRGLQFGFHLLYGWVTAVIFRLLNTLF